MKQKEGMGLKSSEWLQLQTQLDPGAQYFFLHLSFISATNWSQYQGFFVSVSPKLFFSQISSSSRKRASLS